MLTRRRYTTKELFQWTRYEFFAFLLYAFIICFLYNHLGWTFLYLPWVPIGVIGTAVAFILGFQNNAAYDRIWEARKIWGGIVNTSRSWAIRTISMVHKMPQHEQSISEEEIHQIKKQLIHRHIAWMTALRYSMRQSKPWENNQEEASNREFQERIYVPERKIPFEEAIRPYLSDAEWEYLQDKSNKAATLMNLQSKHITKLMNDNLIWDFSFLELQNVLQELVALQGKSERIKNFPYPRQYTTIGYVFTWAFIICIPFGVVPEFAEVGDTLAKQFHSKVAITFDFLAAPFTAILSWIFHTMMRIGSVGENPFEGGANDVPISAISRTIERDMLEMLNTPSNEIPKNFEVKMDVIM